MFTRFCLKSGVVFATAIIASLIAAVPVLGQTLRGQVIDASSRAPIAGASLLLVDSAGNRLAIAISDTAGEFLMSAPRAGHFGVRADRIGYQSSLSEFLRFNANELIVAEIVMSVSAVTLEPLRITARAALERGRDGFGHRMARGKGYFLTGDSIALRKPVQASDVFRGVKQVSLQFVTEVDAITGVKRIVPLISNMGAAACLGIFLNHQVDPIGFYAPRGSLRQAGAVYSGGGGLQRGSTSAVKLAYGYSALNDIIDPAEIRGIELYTRPADVPAEFMKAIQAEALWPKDQLGRCGVIRIWTNAAW